MKISHSTSNWLSIAIFFSAIFPLPFSSPAVQQENATEPHAEKEINFNRDVRPILAANCFACHGMDAESRTADLRLDVREDAMEMEAIVPGEPAESSLIQRIFSEDAESLMPPPESNKSLSGQQKQILKRWVEQGAEYQKHWALIPPERPKLSDVENKSWVRNPIDQIVLRGLERENLKPAPTADANTIFRRLHLDISGLPPSVDETKQFVADFNASDKKDRVLSDWIDRLMERSSWGEHRARYWLDAARYADTHGMHYDNYREMWPYRDWVIRSFNKNQPFNQFVTEQLAGDLLENSTREQKVATGFQRCNMTTNEGGTIAEENLAIYAADRVQTFGWVFLGLTTNCAQCHDHKFDPISTKDYYSLAAFFRNTTQKALDGNRKDGNGPVMLVPSDKDLIRWEALPEKIAAAEKELSKRRESAKPDYEKWLASVDAESIGSMPTSGLILHLPLNEGDGDVVTSRVHEQSIKLEEDDKKNEPKEFKSTTELKWEKDGVLGPAPRLTKDSTIELGELGDFGAEDSYSAGCWVKTSARRSGAIVGRMDNENSYRGWDIWQNDGEFATHIIDKWTENGFKIITTGKRVKPKTWQHVLVTWDGSGKSQGLKIYVDGKLAKSKVQTNNLKQGADTHTKTPLRLGRRSTGQYPFEGSIQDFVLYDRLLEPKEVANLVDAGPLRLALETPEPQRNEALKNRLLENFLRNEDDQFIKLESKFHKLTKEREAIEKRSPVTHVQVEKKSEPMAHVLMRGAYDKKGEKLSAAPPSALHSMPEGAPTNRLGLARWVTDRKNPLTARVTVNRFWQEVFGTGIVATSEDFGIMGTPPSNQELLDWLAIEFQESGWDVKKLFKLILSSNTYRQSAKTTKEKIERDLENRLLSRGPRFRMDAEMVRDYALASSGLLNPKMFGPGARPYQPDNLWDVVGLPGGDTRKYKQDKGDAVYRRTVYSFWKRMSPPPNLDVFNAPSREICTVRRERTNTPLQALTTLNDPQFFEAARILAQNAMKACDSDRSATMEYIAAKVLCRKLAVKETEILENLFDEFSEHYSKNDADVKALLAVGQSTTETKLDASALAAWTMICNQLMNLDEALNK